MHARAQQIVSTFCFAASAAKRAGAASPIFSIIILSSTLRLGLPNGLAKDIEEYDKFSETEKNKT